MIKAMIFDLDGTLVQTERLKAISYAKAAVKLCPYDVEEGDVVEAFKDLVGLPRRKVADALVDRFSLSQKASERMDEFGVKSPWQAYVQVRLQIYGEMLSDPEVLQNNQWPHNVALLQQARYEKCLVGLATMSSCTQTQHVLKILGLKGSFDFVATKDDVENGKPDPEIYLLVADALGINPSECLVIEDSPTGVKAALSAGMEVVAVSTPFTKERLHESALLPDSMIIDNPGDLADRVSEYVGKFRKDKN